MLEIIDGICLAAFRKTLDAEAARACGRTESHHAPRIGRSQTHVAVIMSVGLKAMLIMTTVAMP